MVLVRLHADGWEQPENLGPPGMRQDRRRPPLLRLDLPRLPEPGSGRKFRGWRHLLVSQSCTVGRRGYPFRGVRTGRPRRKGLAATETIPGRRRFVIFVP